jgi:ribosomal protein S18 acetylase RimI-like enzyme/sugar phosphate isomerase/epimerase
MKIIRIDSSNRHLITKFLSDAGDSLLKFRYFSKRSLDVLDNHLATYVITEEDAVLCYGHLDREDGKVWLGIAATEKARGKGLGRMMMDALVGEGKKAGLDTIVLSVDNDNHPAIALYRKYGFVRTEEREHFSFYRLNLGRYDWKNVVAVSTLAFMGKTVEEIIDTAQKEDLVIEFSSGLPAREDMEEVFLTAPVQRMPHNYFPAPEEPFVLNLASSSKEIRKRSVDHCIRGLQLSSAVGAPFFSAHAGFCIDPRPAELGRQLSRTGTIDREHNWKLFISSVKDVLGEAERLSTGFLIENNVLAPFNVYEDGTNPLLCVDGPEMLRLIKEVDHNLLGLLLDTAHLKVSAQTLKFNASEAVEQIKPFVKAIHHSDNDGASDTNEPLKEDYWFMKHMNEWNENVVHVVEVKRLDMNTIKEQIQLINVEK